MRRLILTLLCMAVSLAAAERPVYVVLWFDTEDYIEPAADDAALRIATDLTALGVHATFKVVGEKARVLEQRKRTDLIQALGRHDIGYHAENHSIQPAPAVYLRDMGWLDGAAEFERREGRGVADIQRIFGVTPSCYGQPGSSWGPQSYRALLHLGIPMYMDEGSQVGLRAQPFWFGGVFHVFGMQRFLIRPELDADAKVPATFARFDQVAAELRAKGGGVISTYYHPTEFVTTEFWDAANFAKGASRERADWQRPKRRTPEESERCYRILSAYVKHALGVTGVKFVTARELMKLYTPPVNPIPVDRTAAARQLRERITFLETKDGAYSAAELLESLLGMKPMAVEGPTSRFESNLRSSEIPKAMFDRAKADTVNFMERNGRLPSVVWIGSERLSLADFAATVAANENSTAPAITMQKGNLEVEKYISNEPEKSFNWAIHPVGFSAPGLLELGRLQAWTLKPAVLRDAQ
ncbi:MAG: hypothetical protein ABI822_30335 [Bryobacteraceae bacterium]